MVRFMLIAQRMSVEMKEVGATMVDPLTQLDGSIRSLAQPTTSGLLVLSLEAAVPLWIHAMRKWPIERITERAHELADVVASTADVAQFKSAKRGETAAAFNALAEGVACLAYAPGGVHIFGLHFEAHCE